MNINALRDAIEAASHSTEISLATLTIISERRDAKIDSWAIIGILEQVEKIRDCLTTIDEELVRMEGASV